MKSGWKKECLSSFASLKGGFAFKSKEYTEIGTPILRMGNITKDAKINWNKKKQPYMPDERVSEFSGYLLEGGELVICLTDMSSTGHYLGTVALNDRRALLNQRVSKFVFDEGVINKKFLYYALCVPGCRKYLMSDDTGSLQKNTSHGHVLDYEIAYPVSLNHQELIVAEIEKQFSRLDEAVANLKRVKANLKRYKASVLKAAVDGKLTEEWRKRHPDVEPADKLLDLILEERRANWQGRGKYKEPVAPDTTGLPGLPKGWTRISVEQVAEVGTGATPLRSRSEYYDGGKIPWITSGALNQEFVPAAKEYITDLAVQETNAKVFPSHTLVVAMYGEGKTRGKVSELLIEAATNQACAAIVLDGLSQNARDYIKMFFLKNYEDIRRLSSGGVQPNLNLAHIKKTLIPFPPLAEQYQIAAEVERRISVLSGVEGQVNANLRRADRLRQSILKKAFSGKLATLKEGQ